MTNDDLLAIINEGLKKPLIESDIFVSDIEINYLKRIDKIFNKRLNFYLDPKVLEKSNEVSIFFRKTKFETDLNIGAKKIVNKFEEAKISLSAISKLAELNIERILPIYNIKDNPKDVAFKIREELYPSFNYNKKDFLKSLISTFADKNILVFEFVETWNKKEKANIDGFFLTPNFIVLKRQQSSFRREIFTLAHELGHYLINEEEIEQLDIYNLANKKISDIERWCNDFAYYFLAGDFDNKFDEIEIADVNNDYYSDLIEDISSQTHISKIALFTRLLFKNKISINDYHIIKKDLDSKYLEKQEREKEQREIDNRNGIKKGGSTPKPINSPLFISTIQLAYYEGIISEYDVCKSLNIPPTKLGKYIQ